MTQHQHGGVVLEPELTKLDEKVLAGLARWPDSYEWPVTIEWRNAWQVAERIREYDVREIQRVLRGITHLGYALSRNFDWRQEWVATRRQEERDHG